MDAAWLTTVGHEREKSIEKLEEEKKKQKKRH